MKRLSVYHSKMPEINKRIYRIIDFNHANCINKFATSIGIPPSSIYRLYRKNKRTQKYPRPTIQIIISIIEAYPDINANWILTGEGSLFLNAIPPRQGSNTEKYLYSYIKKQDEEIKKQAIEIGHLIEKIDNLSKGKGKN